MPWLELVVDNGSRVMPLTQAQSTDKEQLIIISVVKPDARIEIVRQKHDIECVKDWFRIAVNDLDAAPTCLRGKPDNLLIKISDFYANASEHALEKYADELYEFRTKHDIRFAFRGTNVASAIICREGKKLCIHYRHGDDFLFDYIDLCDLAN